MEQTLVFQMLPSSQETDLFWRVHARQSHTAEGEEQRPAFVVVIVFSLLIRAFSV
jgi:hypothetical protein